jgi:hypothetical protein
VKVQTFILQGVHALDMTVGVTGGNPNITRVLVGWEEAQPNPSNASLGCVGAGIRSARPSLQKLRQRRVTGWVERSETHQRDFTLHHPVKIEDMDFPGARLHQLKGNRAGV